MSESQDENEFLRNAINTAVDRIPEGQWLTHLEMRVDRMGKINIRLDTMSSDGMLRNYFYVARTDNGSRNVLSS